MIAPDEPFLHAIPKRWIPREMTTAPVLDPNEPRGLLERRYALLINPFYPKDANASFGKHVLTPTLALIELCGNDARALAGRILGREPARRKAAIPADASCSRHNRAFDLREAGL